MKNWEIIDEITNLHRNPEDLDEGDLIERVNYCDEYELTTVCVDLLDEEWATSEELVLKYQNLDPKKCPPIVVIKYSEDNYSVIDGAHRLQAFKNLGLTRIPAYLGIAK